MFSAFQSTSSYTRWKQRPNLCILATLSFLKQVQNWPKTAVLNLVLCCGAIWPQYRCTTTFPPVHNCLIYFGKFTSYMTFGACILVHSEPFLDSWWEIWQLLLVLYCEMQKNFYIDAHLQYLLWYESCGGFFDISEISNLYKVVCTNFSANFWTFHNFLTAISRKLWRHLATEMQTI